MALKWVPPLALSLAGVLALNAAPPEGPPAPTPAPDLLHFETVMGGTPPAGADPYKPGPHSVEAVTVEASAAAPSFPTLVLRPLEPGAYPTLVLLHGFTLTAPDYHGLLEHVASHGFIAMSATLYRFPWIPSIEKEAEGAVEVARWAADGLPGAPMPSGVVASGHPPVLAGHSRGGAAAWTAAVREKAKGSSGLGLSGIAGLDPVDLGLGRRGSTLLPDPSSPAGVVPGAFGLPYATLVTGAGGWNGCEDRRYEQFYAQSVRPRELVVVAGAGHMDLLDDRAAKIQSLAFPEGIPRVEGRARFGGLLVAFLRGLQSGGRFGGMGEIPEGLGEHRAEAPATQAATAVS